MVEVIDIAVDYLVESRLMCFSVEESKFFAPSLELQILVSPPKRSTRLEWLVEKCGELGVRRLSFVQTKRTQRASISVPRLQRIAISSLKQSQQPYLLQIRRHRAIYYSSVWLPSDHSLRSRHYL